MSDAQTYNLYLFISGTLCRSSCSSAGLQTSTLCSLLPRHRYRIIAVQKGLLHNAGNNEEVPHFKFIYSIFIRYRFLPARSPSLDTVIAHRVYGMNITPAQSHRTFLDKMIFHQPAKKFPDSYRTQRPITMFTETRH